MEKASRWQRLTDPTTVPNPLADERFRQIEAAGPNTAELLGFDSWAEVYLHVQKLRDDVGQELPFAVRLNDRVQDAGHFAVLSHLLDVGEYRTQAFSASFSLYGKLASVFAHPDWITPERMPYLERFAELVAEAGFEPVPRSDLNLPYTGTTFRTGWWVNTWHDLFFNYL